MPKFVASLVTADGESNVSIDTIPPDTTPPPQVTSLEIVATTVAMQSTVPKTDHGSRDVVAAGLIGGAVILSAAWWLMVARGRPKPL